MDWTDTPSISVQIKRDSASFNLLLSWYGSARKLQLDDRGKVKLLRNFVLKELNHLDPYNGRKRSECLILSKIDYNVLVSDPIPVYLFMRFEILQLAAARFVLGRYAIKQDLLKLKHLKIKSRARLH